MPQAVAKPAFAFLLAFWPAIAQDLVRIPAGEYEVADQITGVKVRVFVTEFLLGATEVTQSEYQHLTATNPSTYRGANRPVENVSWWDAIVYSNRRSKQEGLTPCYDESTGQRGSMCNGYRLPTEAEWRMAAGAVVAADLPKKAKLGTSSTKSTGVLTRAMESGTAPVRSLAADAAGLYDMYGNVWEWCEDFFDAMASPDAAYDPQGPSTGVARVIRGGSFVSTTSRWSREYRSSMDPKSRSRFTGFRLARSIPTSRPVLGESESFFRPYQNPPAGFESSTGPLSPMVKPGAPADSWKRTSASLQGKWESLLAPPRHEAGTVVKTRVLREVTQRNFSGRMLEFESEPDIWEKIYILEPGRSARHPLPVMIVPFYDVDTPAAMDLGGRNYDSAKGVNAFAYSAAQRGYLAVAVRWFGESYGESYSEAVANLARRHPGSTGLGKWVADARRLCDLIATLPGADASRIGIIGHSLGGKMALYGAALEPRIRAVVASEPGIGFRMSNYDDYWYWGDRFSQVPSGTDQHELIALLAPRPFLLIGGDEYDKNESWHYINAARAVYELLGKPQNIGYLNHHTGHTPSPDSVRAAFDWLDYFLKP